MCSQRINKSGWREIAQAVSLLFVETDKRRDAAIDDMIKQFNECLRLVEEELNEKTEQIEGLQVDVSELKVAFINLCEALRGGENEGNKEGQHSDSAGNAHGERANT